MFNLKGLISSLKTSNYHLIERQMVAVLQCVRKIQKDSQVSRIWSVHCSHCFALIFSHILRIFPLSSFISSHIWHPFFCFGSSQLRLHLSPPVVPVFLFFVRFTFFMSPFSYLWLLCASIPLLFFSLVSFSTRRSKLQMIQIVVMTLTQRRAWRYQLFIFIEKISDSVLNTFLSNYYISIRQTLCWRQMWENLRSLKSGTIMYKFIWYKTASYMVKTNPHLIIFQLLNPNFIQEGEIHKAVNANYIYLFIE